MVSEDEKPDIKMRKSKCTLSSIQQALIKRVFDLGLNHSIFMSQESLSSFAYYILELQPTRSKLVRSHSLSDVCLMWGSTSLSNPVAWFQEGLKRPLCIGMSKAAFGPGGLGPQGRKKGSARNESHPTCGLLSVLSPLAECLPHNEQTLQNYCGRWQWNEWLSNHVNNNSLHL